MRTSSEGIAGESREGIGRPKKIRRLLWLRMMEFWIFMAIFIFFLIRVLGSHTSQSFLNGIVRRLSHE